MSAFTNRSWGNFLQTMAAALSAVFLTTFAHAFVDTNENGASDIWEKHYNSGNLFTTFDPLADPDGDGWTNEMEAISGTDPDDGNPPTGCVRPVIAHFAAVYTTDSNGDPVLLTPEAITVTWPTLAGKRYTLLASFDLSEGSWIPIDDDTPRISTGADMANAIPLTQTDGSSPPSMFLRVAISDTDTDADELNDYEENQLVTNPADRDTDGDDLPDGWEVRNGIDPKDNGSVDPDNGASGDPDEDGIPNATDSSPFQKDDFVAKIDSVDIHMFSDQGGHHRTESTNTTKVSLDRLFLRYPDPGVAVPVAYISTMSSGAFGDMLKASIKIEATATSTESRRIKIMKILDFFDLATPNEFKDPLIFTIPAGSLESQTIQVNPGIEDLDGEHPDPDLRQVVLAVPVEIVPANKMAGVIGDVIKPMNPARDVKHFVTPQQTDELPQEYVILKAVGISIEHITDGHPNQLFEWEGGEEVPGDILKRRVSRSLAGEPVKVKLKAKNGGMVAAEMDVWVVWSNITIKPGKQVSFTPYPNNAGVKYEVPLTLGESWRFVFSIKPSSITDPLAVDRPDLSGANKTDAPGASKPYTIKPNLGEGDNAELKWDVSRQYEVIIRNSGNVNTTGLTPTAWYINQPTVVDTPVQFPSLDSEGNDDPKLVDEQANPYQQYSGDDLDHEISELSSKDSPSLSMETALGISGAYFSKQLNFKEFARV